MAQNQQRNLGKISLINGDEDKSVVATAVIITERGVVKIKDDNRGTLYTLCGCDKPSLCMCVRWVHQYKDRIQKKSVYINDPHAAAGYAANLAKAERQKAEKASKWQQPSRQYHQQPMTPKPQQAPIRTSLTLPTLPQLPLHFK